MARSATGQVSATTKATSAAARWIFWRRVHGIGDGADLWRRRCPATTRPAPTTTANQAGPWGSQAYGVEAPTVRPGAPGP